MINEMFYKKFNLPDAAYRAKPFWAWNCRLEREELLWQIEKFKEMGMGGFVIHSRQGMSLPYLGDDFMSLVSDCVQKAKQENMQVWLYDEDRCPSGTAGGLVTENNCWRGRRVVVTATKRPNTTEEDPLIYNRHLPEGGVLLARYGITLNKSGELQSYRRLAPNEKAENVRYAYLEYTPVFPYYNDHSYLDTLCREAVECFLDITYNRYKDIVGEDFGGVIPAIFTDEPQFYHQIVLGRADGNEEAVLPFTDELERTYLKRWDESLIEHLPELVWELPDGAPSRVRWRYHETVAEMFASCFADTLGAWCEEHNIALTGHVMNEHCLLSQTASVGEAMRSYRSFQMPGIDILCDAREYSTVKQCQSAVRQKGAAGMTSELYGVTNWDYDFRGHKLQGDWQAAMGVTNRVPHLSWVSMEGEGKRDYPASIQYQSPWYKEYCKIEDYFSRINTALTQGKPCVRVGMIHPIESYWTMFGPKENTESRRERLQQQYDRILEWLLFGLVEFDLISESSLTDGAHARDGKLVVGEMEYDTVLISGCMTIRRSTLNALQSFKNAGGRVIILSDAPKYVEACADEELTEWVNTCECIPFDSISLMNSLSDCREVDLKDENGVRDGRYIYQLRCTDDGWWAFFANGRDERIVDMPAARKRELCFYMPQLTEKYRIYLFDTEKGSISEIPSHYTDGCLNANITLYDHDSLLVYVTDAAVYGVSGTVDFSSKWQDVCRLPQPTCYRLSEPNVLVLDQAELSLDGGEFEPADDVLTWDNRLCERLGYPKKQDGMIQPWANHIDNETEHSVTLCFHISSRITVTKPLLALEQAERAEIYMNGEKISNHAVGYFVDKSIKTVELPDIKSGETVIEITLPYGRRSSLEWMYILGDFGVHVCGNQAYITNREERIGFGDWCPQGLPFYAGNVTYVCEIDTQLGEYSLVVPKYRAPLLTVSVDGKRMGEVMHSPYRVDLGVLTAGRHTVEITAYGNRINAFGQLHNCNENEWYYGPETWRSKGFAYAYEYQLHRCGVLTSPYLQKK